MNESNGDETRPTIMTDELLGAHPNLIRRGIFRGVNLTVLRARFWRLDSMRADDLRSPPTVRWRAWNSNWVGGMADTLRNQITMRIGQDASIEDAVEVLLHETVHCSCHWKEHHGELFCRRLIACAREAFGLDLDTAALLTLSPGEYGKRAYAIDKFIKETMIATGVGARLRANPETWFDPPPPGGSGSRRRSPRQAAPREGSGARSGPRGESPSKTSRVGTSARRSPQEGVRVAHEGAVLRAPSGEAGWVVSKKVTIELDFGSDELATQVDAGSGGVDIGQLLRDALGEFANKRSPVIVYVNERYASQNDKFKSFKIRDVRKRILMARTLACATVTILVGAEEERMPSNDEDYQPANR